MNELVDYVSEVHRVWQEYRRTDDLGVLKDEMLTNPIITTLPDYLEGFFYLALEEKDVSAAQLFIDLGVSRVTKPACDGCSMLHEAIEQSANDPKMVKFLLDHGAGIAERGMNNWTPLHTAAIRGHAKVVEFLLDRGASIDAGTVIDGDLTPLMKAAEAGKLETVTLLLKRGADPQIEDKFFGQTAARMAAERGHLEIARYLQERRWK